MNEIPSYSDMYAGEYFSPEDFGPGESLVVTITAHMPMELTVRGKGKNWKMVLTVADQIKKVAVNKTSWKRLILAWGKDFDSWIGGQIRIERGEVNGKAATLCTPQRRAVVTPPVFTPENKAKQAVYAACGGDRDQAVTLWAKLKTKHGDNYEGIIAECAIPPL